MILYLQDILPPTKNVSIGLKSVEYVFPNSLAPRAARDRELFWIAVNLSIYQAPINSIGLFVPNIWTPTKIAQRVQLGWSPDSVLAIL